MLKITVIYCDQDQAKSSIHVPKLAEILTLFISSLPTNFDCFFMKSLFYERNITGSILKRVHYLNNSDFKIFVYPSKYSDFILGSSVICFLKKGRQLLKNFLSVKSKLRPSTIFV